MIRSKSSLNEIFVQRGGSANVNKQSCVDVSVGFRSLVSLLFLFSHSFTQSNFFLEILGGHMSFYEATDTPISFYFWCRLLWVSKPVWAALLALGRGVCDLCSLRITSGVTPADFLAARMVAGCSSLHCTVRMTDWNGRPPV